MKAVNTLTKLLLFETVFQNVFFLWIRRICEFRRVNNWNGILSNSVKYALSFHPDDVARPAFCVSSRTPIQGASYVEAPRVLTA